MPVPVFNIASVGLVIKACPYPRKRHDLVGSVRQHGFSILIEHWGAVKIELGHASAEELHYLSCLIEDWQGERVDLLLVNVTETNVISKRGQVDTYKVLICKCNLAVFFPDVCCTLRLEVGQVLCHER